MSEEIAQRMYNIKDAFQHTLCLDLTPQKLVCVVVDQDQKKIIHTEEYELDAFKRENVEKVLDATLFKADFKQHILASGTERNTLLPVDLFNHSKPADVFALNHPKPFENIDYNRIPELGIVNVYEFPLWIKSLFVVRFPRIKLVHRSTVLLKGIFDQPVFQPKIHLFLESTQFYLLITKKGRLDYFNRFEFKDVADLVYYILFVLEQKEYAPEDFELKLYGKDHTWEDFEQFQTFFTNKIKTGSKEEEGKHFIRVKQLLCV